MKTDTIIILSLILSILLVFVYVGSSVVGFFGGLGGDTTKKISDWWTRNINDPLTNFTSKIDFSSFLDRQTKIKVNDTVLQGVYEKDIFIFRIDDIDTDKEYLAHISNVSESDIKRIYTVKSFLVIEGNVNIISYLKAHDLPLKNIDCLFIPYKDQKLIENLEIEEIIHIYSENYDAYLKFCNDVEDLYELSITKK